MRKRKWFKPYLYCVIVSFLFLMICSKNSFLYQINDWVDANAFFTVGKGMVRGVVPYQQLFEQKGPLLYLIYGIGSLISYKSFFGVFLLEIFSFSIFLYYTYKTINLFCKQEKAYIILPIFTLCIVTLKSFSHGGSAEEFSLPFIMLGIYYLVRYLKEDTLSFKNIIIAGISAGCILWIKYTLLGFWFSWMMCVFFIMITKKHYRQAFQRCLLFLGGMLIATIPWIIYFLANHAWTDLIDVYFLVNMNAYPHKLSLLVKLAKTIELILYNVFGNPVFFLFIAVGFFLLFAKGNKWGCRGSNIVLMTCFAFTGLGVYIGGTNFHYYPFVLSPFILIGFIIIASQIKMKKVEMLSLYLLPMITICMLSAYYTSSNAPMLKYNKKDYAQYLFADIINQKKDASILNYGFLDGGFYITTGKIPEYYYFMKNNIPYENYPDMLDEQRRYIKEQRPDFIIAKDSAKLEFDPIHQHYQVVKTYNQRYQSKNVKYVLFQKRSL